MDMYGYTTLTTFWQDFSIADIFGEEAIRDTYRRAFKEWKTDYKYLTELVMVLNWKLWHYYEEGDEEYAVVYDELWKQADEYACENLKGAELTYFLKTTD